MSIRTLLLFLIGQRKAMVDITQSPSSIWVGLLLVFSAGFAREYDQEFLLAKPWMLLLPPLASLGVAFLLFCVLSAVFGMTPPFKRVAPQGDNTTVETRQFWRSFRVFLTFFWMTAPLAWLYAIPYERFLEPYPAVAANLWTLGLVATWRVLLISRVASVLWNVSPVIAFLPVMLLADTVAVVAIGAMPKPILSVMGGIEHTAVDNLILGVSIQVIFLGILSFPVWLIVSVIIMFKARSTERLSNIVMADASAKPTQAVWAFTTCTIIAWIPILFLTQPEQARAWHAERLLNHGQLKRGLTYLSDHDPQDFPPLWTPPPRQWITWQIEPELDEVLATLVEIDAAEWVDEAYVERAMQVLPWHPMRFFDGRDEGLMESLSAILARMPDGKQRAIAICEEISDYGYPIDYEEGTPEYIFSIYKTAGEPIPEEFQPGDAD